MSIWKEKLLKIWPDLDQETYVKMFGSTVSYLIGNIKEPAYHRELASFVDFPNDLTPKGLRLIVRDTAYLILNVKFCAMFIVKSQRISNYSALASNYGIHPDDMVVLRQAMKNNMEQSEEVRALPLDFVTHDKLAVVRKNISLMLPDLQRTYISGRVHKELRYIFLYNNETPDNYVHDLISFAIHAYYKSTPKILGYTKEHAFRHVRKAIENRIKCLHDYNSAEQRARLKSIGKDANGNHISVLQTMSQVQMPLTTDGEEVEYDQLGTNVSQETADQIRDIACGVNQLLRKYVNKPQTKNCVEILFDVDSVEFKNFLASEKLLKESNVSMDEVFEYLGYDMTLACISDYLGVHLAKLRGFIKYLKEELNLGSIYANQ